MKRWSLVVLCVIGSAMAVALGLIVPVHLRAIDKAVLARAGAKSPTVVEHGLAMVNDGNHGAADLLLAVASRHRLAGTPTLEAGVTNLAKRGSRVVVWGMQDSRLEALFWADPSLNIAAPQALAEMVLRLENRGKVLSYLRVSPRPVIQELMRSRSLTNTVLMPPSSSPSGQAYDAAVCVGGLLLDRAQLTPQLTGVIYTNALRANLGGDTEPLESNLLDLLSLAQRMNFSQLVIFLSRVHDAASLQGLAQLTRSWEAELPLVFAVVHLSGMPEQVADYATKFSASARGDFVQTLPLNSGAFRELIGRQQRLHQSRFQNWALAWEPSAAFVTSAAEYAWLMPWVALFLKGTCYFIGGFLLSLGVHFAWPRPTALELPLQVPGFHMAREALFGVGFLVLVLILNEPFLASQPQKPEISIRLRLPSIAAIVPAAKPMIHSLMTQSLLTLLLFFVLQALLYTMCLIKLAEIRRQQVPARTRLKLLDNEDHLFDAGLYLGFAGTIISLILVSMGIIGQSLMAAYSSTSFGIVFVSIFKICHLRPVRRRLLLESEQDETGGQVPSHESWATQP